MKNQIYTTLNNGLRMPMLGLGAYDMYDDEAEQAVLKALEIGYRLVDTASAYKNEEQVGKAIRTSGIPREEIFVTTKVANGDQGYENTLRAFDTSMRKLDIDYIDLYLMHWPISGKRKDTWKAMEKLYNEKQVKSIGVANYLMPFFEEFNSYANIVPVVNQVEFSPYLYNDELLKHCKQNKIQLQAYTPLVRGKKFSDPRLMEIAGRHKKTPAQVILRWNIDIGVAPIPKSVSGARLKENFDVFDFNLSKEEIELMKSFDENLRVCENPMDFM